MSPGHGVPGDGRLVTTRIAFVGGTAEDGEALDAAELFAPDATSQ